MTALGVSRRRPPKPARDLCRQILAIHDTLAALPALEPGPVVNQQFAELVRLCEYRSGEDARHVLRDPRIQAVIPRLRRLCAAGEFALERAWARSIIGAEDPQARLEDFPYRANYEELTTLELHALAGVGLDLLTVHRVCFLGGGPLPLSALLMSRDLGVPVDVVDLSGEATALGAQVAQRVSRSSQVHFHQADAADFDQSSDSDVVVLAALVGLEREAKHRILQTLSARMRTGSMLVIRSSHGLRTLLYPPVELADLGGWRPLAVLHPLNDVVNSVLIAVHR